MDGTRAADRLLALEFFLTVHNAVLDAALRAYTEDMTQRGEMFIRLHDSAPQDERRGLLYMAASMDQSAEKAQAALEALFKLGEYDPGEEG